MSAYADAVRSAGRSDRGKVRTRNEDAFLDQPRRGLWAVADGMGGHQAGDLASQMVVAELDQLVLDGSFDERLRQVRKCLHWTHHRLGHELTVIAGLPDRVMGSTVVALLRHDQRAACIWAGDSRCYLWRDQQLFQLTRDHSLRQQLLDQQRMSAEQARQHPGASALTRALGARAPLRLAIIELQVQPGDAFLLCSDGLYQSLDAAVLGRALAHPLPTQALEQLFRCVMAGRAGDNLTGVVIRP